jgi:hypothetical protein
LATWCGSGAFEINVPNTAYTYVFKSPAALGNSVIAFEVQGTPSTVTAVSDNAGCSSNGMDVAVTATLDNALPGGQATFLRYTDDGFASSTVIQMTCTGTSCTANIPAGTNTSGASISYYVFTSGSSVTPNHGNADWYTINGNTNGGSNYSYTVPPSFTATVECDNGAGTEAGRDEFYVHVNGLNSASTYDLSATGATALTGQTGATSYVLGPISHSGSGDAIITLSVTDQANGACSITAELPEKLCGYTVIADGDSQQDDLHASGYFCVNPTSSGAAPASPGILVQAMPPTVNAGDTVSSEYVYVLYEDSDASGTLNSTDAVSDINQTGFFPGLTNGDTYFVEAINIHESDVANLTGSSPADKAAVDVLVGGNCGISCGVATYTLSCCLADSGDIAAPSGVMSIDTVCEGNGVGGAYAASYAAGDETAPAPSANYDYGFILVDAGGTVVSSNTTGDFDAFLSDQNVTTQTTYRVFGISYSKALNTPNTLNAYLTSVTGDGDTDDLAQIQAAASATGTEPVCLDIEGLDNAGTQISITINPEPDVNPTADVTYCNDDAGADIVFSGAVTGTTYNWTSSVDVGFGTTGSASTGSFTATNAGTTPVTAMVIVTPTANSCPGTPDTFMVTVNPTPTVNATADVTYCNGDAGADIVFSGAVTGTSYN